MFADEIGIELMRLYRELRNAADPIRREALKARIDRIVADAAGQVTTSLPPMPGRGEEKEPER